MANFLCLDRAFALIQAATTAILTGHPAQPLQKKPLSPPN